MQLFKLNDNKGSIINLAKVNNIQPDTIKGSNGYYILRIQQDAGYMEARYEMENSQYFKLDINRLNKIAGWVKTDEK